MHDNSSDDYEDFIVCPALEKPAREFIESIAKLRQSLTAADLEIQSDDNESNNDVLVRLALNGSDNNTVMYRKNDSAEEIKIQAWLSMIKEISKKVLFQNEIRNFEGLSTEDLRVIAKLNTQPNRTNELIDYLARSYGVILIVKQGFKAMKMDGCVFTLSQGTPVVGVSIRYNRYDNFWFTLMHELAHICLHYDKLAEPILDDLDEVDTSEIEIEANVVAKDSLVERHFWRTIWNVRQNESQFLSMCSKAEVHPAIAAGMLRHQSNNYTLYPKLVDTMDMRQAFGFKND